MQGLLAIAEKIDCFSETLGKIVSRMILLMVAITFGIVVLRYGFNWGRIWMQESYVWINGIVFMLGASFTMLKDAHVRVDIVYRGATGRAQAFIDLLGSLFLLLPTMAIIGYLSFPYIAQSWRRFEASREANGLPGLFLLKSVLLIFAALMFLQGLSLAIRSLAKLSGNNLCPPSQEHP